MSVDGVTRRGRGRAGGPLLPAHLRLPGRILLEALRVGLPEAPANEERAGNHPRPHVSPRTRAEVTASPTAAPRSAAAAAAPSPTPPAPASSRWASSARRRGGGPASRPSAS